jgi:aminoglycoside phosphotransferase
VTEKLSDPVSRSIPELRPDLWRLIQGLETPLVAATLISRLPAIHTGRASYRLQLSGRRFLKGRCCESAAAAARIEALMALLPAGHFPRLLARRGEALLIEWIAGARLRPSDCTTALLRECGELQAAIHRLPVPKRARVSLSRRSPAWQEQLEQELRQLVSAEELTAGEAGAVLRLAERHAPALPCLAVCHGDLCAENIVKGAADRFYVVDNETVAVDACEYDLARTWYRWPMTDRQHAVYLEGYGQGAPRWSFAEHFLHFAVVVLVESAAYRLRVHAPRASVPLGRLRGVLSRADPRR